MVCAGIYIDVHFGDVKIPLQADPTQNFYEQAEIIYDALNQRIALTEIQDIRGSEELYRDILLYEEVYYI